MRKQKGYGVMTRLIRAILLAEFAGAAMALAQTGTVQQAELWERSKPAAPTRQTNTTQHAQPKSAEPVKTDEAGVDEAVKWERAKDRAADRQAEIESGGTTTTTKNTATKSKKK